MEIICKTDIRDIISVGDIFKDCAGIKGIVTRVDDLCFDYLEIDGKVIPGKHTNMLYEAFKANNMQVIGNILNAKIAYNYKLGTFIPKVIKSNLQNHKGSIIMTTVGRLAFMVSNDPRRNYCELIYLEPPVDNNFSKVMTTKYFYSDKDFIYRLASYKDYSLVLL